MSPMYPAQRLALGRYLVNVCSADKTHDQARQWEVFCDTYMQNRNETHTRQGNHGRADPETRTLWGRRWTHWWLRRWPQ